jgi:SH3 domain-containing YSC84-like protein 1
MRQVSLALLAGMIGMLNLSAAHAETVAERLSSATTVLEEIMTAPDKGIPQDLLDKAHCIVAVPGVKKAAFVVGGKYGRGFISCRDENRRWSSPGGSVGWQIGASETDVVLLVMNQSGM